MMIHSSRIADDKLHDTMPLTSNGISVSAPAASNGWDFQPQPVRLMSLALSCRMRFNLTRIHFCFNEKLSEICLSRVLPKPFIILIVIVILHLTNF